MRLFMSLLALPLVALAQSTMPTEFPADATQATDEALTERVAGKVLRAKIFDGTTWRLEYKKNGYLFLNTGGGFSDTGKWSTKDGQLCSEWKVVPTGGCFQTRISGNAIYIKRNNTGEVVALRAD